MDTYLLTAYISEKVECHNREALEEWEMRKQLQIENICSVRIGILYLICEMSPKTQNHCDETMQGPNDDLKPEHKKTTSRTHIGLAKDIDCQAFVLRWFRYRLTVIYHVSTSSNPV